MIHTDIIAFIGSTLTNTILELETETYIIVLHRVEKVIYYLPFLDYSVDGW